MRTMILNVHDSVYDNATVADTELQGAADTTAVRCTVLVAKTMRHVTSRVVIFADAMRLLSKLMTRLDVVAKKYIGVAKIDAPQVSYARLYDTWSHGNTDDVELLLAYCLMDSLVVMLLLRVTKVNDFYVAISRINGMSVRELFMQRSTYNVLNILANCGARDGVLMPPTVPCVTIEGLEKMLHPECEKDVDVDFEKTQMGAGMTANNIGMFNNMYATFDFSSQYPSLM